MRLNIGNGLYQALHGYGTVWRLLHGNARALHLFISDYTIPPVHIGVGQAPMISTTTILWML
jgi:hypothetical protein